jgi:anti-anti-sigma factor
MRTSLGTHALELPGAIHLVEEDGELVLRLSGEVDSLVVDDWHATASTGSRSAVAVDVSAATFLDCRGLRLLVRETEPTRRSGRVPELRHPTRAVRRVVEMTGAASLFATVG